jgi:hypothetical protein
MWLKIETISTTLKILWNYLMFNFNEFVHIVQGKGKTLVTYSQWTKFKWMMYSMFLTLISLLLVRIIIETIFVVIFGSQDCWIVRTSLPFKVIIKANKNKFNGLYKLPSSNQHVVLLQLFIIENITWIDL